MNGQTGSYFHLSLIEREGFLIMHSDKGQFDLNTWTRPSCATWLISLITPTNTPPFGTLEANSNLHNVLQIISMHGTSIQSLAQQWTQPAHSTSLPRTHTPRTRIHANVTSMDTIAISWRRSQLWYTPLADFFSKSNAYIRLSLPMHKPTINDSYSEERLEDEIPWHHPAWCNKYISILLFFLTPRSFGHTPPENPESGEKAAPHDPLPSR